MADTRESTMLVEIEQRLLEAIEEVTALRDTKDGPSRDYAYYDGMVDAYTRTLAVVRGQSAHCF